MNRLLGKEAVNILCYIIIFLLPFMIRITIWFFGLSSLMGWGAYDTDVYLQASKSYVKAVLSNDMSKFGVNVEHPPLGKLMLGFGVMLFSLFLDTWRAALVTLSIVAGMTAVVIYAIGRLIGGKKLALLAWLLFTLDPYAIRWTVAWLDVFVNLFMLGAIFMLLNEKLKSWKKWAGIGFFGGLATLSKYIAIPYVFLLAVFFAPNVRKFLLCMLTCLFTHILLNVHLWFPHYFMKGLSMNVEMNMGVPAIFYGPIKIGFPITYPWYILTYLGLGYTSWGTGPYIAPIIALAAIIYRVFTKKLFRGNVIPVLFILTSSSLIPLVFLPRQYWIFLGEFPGFKVEEGIAFTKGFYPYYYTITIPMVDLLAASLIARGRHIDLNILFRERVLKPCMFFVLVFLILSPIGFVANTIYPFWDFLFTLMVSIYNPELTIFAYEALIVSILLLISSFMFVFFILSKIKYRI